MASHQQQAEMKKDECMKTVSDTASDVSGQAQMKREDYGNKASEAASHASNKAEDKKEEYTSKGSEATSEAGNAAAAKKDDMMNTARDAAYSAKDNSTVQAAQTYAIELKDQASTLIQQTGEQVKNMAAGAAEAVKSTLGLTADNHGNAAAAAGTDTNRPLINPHNPNQTSSADGKA